MPGLIPKEAVRLPESEDDFPEVSSFEGRGNPSFSSPTVVMFPQGKQPPENDDDENFTPAA